MQASLSPSSESFPSIKSASRLSACIQKFQEMGRFGNMKKRKISEVFPSEISVWQLGLSSRFCVCRTMEGKANFTISILVNPPKNHLSPNLIIELNCKIVYILHKSSWAFWMKTYVHLCGCCESTMPRHSSFHQWWLYVGLWSFP